MALQEIRSARNCRVIWHDELRRNPVDEFRLLFQFAGLEWSDATDAFFQYTTSQHDAEYYSIFRDPLRASEDWKAELPKNVVDGVVSIAHRIPVFAQWAQSST